MYCSLSPGTSSRFEPRQNLPGTPGTWGQFVVARGCAISAVPKPRGHRGHANSAGEPMAEPSAQLGDAVLLPTVFRHELLKFAHRVTGYLSHAEAPPGRWQQGPQSTRSGHEESPRRLLTGGPKTPLKPPETIGRRFRLFQMVASACCQTRSRGRDSIAVWREPAAPAVAAPYAGHRGKMSDRQRSRFGPHSCDSCLAHAWQPLSDPSLALTLFNCSRYGCDPWRMRYGEGRLAQPPEAEPVD
jgi:hypothetical protein